MMKETSNKLSIKSLYILLAFYISQGLALPIAYSALPGRFLQDVLFQCLVEIDISKCSFKEDDGSFKNCDELRSSLSQKCNREVKLEYTVTNIDPDIDITVLHVEGLNEIQTNFIELNPGESITYQDEGEVNVCSITSRMIVKASVEAGNNGYTDPILCDDGAEFFIYPPSHSPSMAPSQKPTTQTPSNKPITSHPTLTEPPASSPIISSVPTPMLPTNMPSTVPTIAPTTSNKPTMKSTKSPKPLPAPRCKFGKTAKSGKSSSSYGNGNGNGKGGGKASSPSGKGKGGKGKGLKEGQVGNSHTYPPSGKGKGSMESNKYSSPPLPPHDNMTTRRNSRRRENTHTTTLSYESLKNKKSSSSDERQTRVLKETNGILNPNKGEPKSPKNSEAPKFSKAPTTKDTNLPDDMKKGTKAPSILDKTKFTKAPSISDTKKDTKAPSLLDTKKDTKAPTISPKSTKAPSHRNPMDPFFPHLGNVTMVDSPEAYCECEELLDEEIEAPINAPKENVDYAIEVFAPPTITIDESMEEYLLAALNYAFHLNLAACGMERSIDDDIYYLSFIEVTLLTSGELEQSILCTNDDEKPYMNSTCSGFTGIVEVTYVAESGTRRKLASVQAMDPLTTETIQLLRDNEEEVRISLEDVEKVQFYSLGEADLSIERPPPNNARRGSSGWTLWVFPLIALVVFVFMFVEYNKSRRKENDARWKQLKNMGSLDYLFKESDERHSDGFFPISIEEKGWEKLEGTDNISNEAVVEDYDKSERNLGCKEFVMPSIQDMQDDLSSDLNSEERKELDDELTELKYFKR